MIKALVILATAFIFSFCIVTLANEIAELKDRVAKLEMLEKVQ